MEIKNITAALSALASAPRLSVFKLLTQAGEDGLAAGKIAELAGITPSSLSFHLKELLHADLVTSRQNGRFVIYTANFETMISAIQYLTENCSCAPCDAVLGACKPSKI